MSEAFTMTKEQFTEASRRVAIYGNLVLGVTAIIVLTSFILAARLAGPTPDHFHRWVESHTSEATGHLMIILFYVLFMVALVFLPLACGLCFDRRYGLRCSGCGRSVTVRCRSAEVLKTGKCCLCEQKLFDPI